MEFAILEGSGLPSPVAHLLSNHYNLTRDRYYAHLAAASRERDLMPFMVYAVQGFADGLREQIREITDTYLLDLVWRDYVDAQLATSEASTQRKQRWKEVAIELFRRGPGAQVRKRDLHTLSPQVAYLYATRDTKTRSRDLDAMEQLALISQHDRVVTVRRDRVLGFRPPTVASE